jgi:predicted AAA+ superfamily ATPase
MIKLQMDANQICNWPGSNLSFGRPLLGHLLETWVVQELRRQASWCEERIQFHHFRDKEGAEVDVVLERAGRRIAGVEVKLSGTVVAKDFRGLKKLRDAAGERFTTGVVLYDGEDTVPFGEGFWAVPLSRLWTGKT